MTVSLTGYAFLMLALVFSYFLINSNSKSSKSRKNFLDKKMRILV